MYEKYLISYNDDNHGTKFWFDGEYLGEDTMEVAESMFGYGMEEGDYSLTRLKTKEICIWDFDDTNLTEQETDIIHCYLACADLIDREIWNCLIKEDYKKIINLIKKA